MHGVNVIYRMSVTSCLISMYIYVLKIDVIFLLYFHMIIFSFIASLADAAAGVGLMGSHGQIYMTVWLGFLFIGLQYY